MTRNKALLIYLLVRTIPIAEVEAEDGSTVLGSTKLTAGTAGKRLLLYTPTEYSK
jgi:hypothetical protein